MMIAFRCPSCAARLAPVETMDEATQILRRTCPRCGETWQLRVRPIRVTAGARQDAADFTFLGHRGASARARAFRSGGAR